ncbi:hypothetical protein QR685DRAFT_162785 [Neurospora intermedia]|uniref:Uncharacterized protein n=1 Tax=Neurospora intermedia TaxID=5142 RepID=A0ABR3DKG8_NEUIN
MMEFLLTTEQLGMLCWYAAFACSKHMMAMSNDETQAMHSAANAGPIELLVCGSGSQIPPRCPCGCTTRAASTSNHSRPFTAWVQHLSIALAPPQGKGRNGRWKAAFKTLTCPIIQETCVRVQQPPRATYKAATRLKLDRAIIVLETKRRSRQNLLGGSGRRCRREENQTKRGERRRACRRSRVSPVYDSSATPSPLVDEQDRSR